MPSYSVESAQLVSPSAADAYYCTPAANCTTSGTRDLWTQNYPVEIPALARALRYDVDLIYDFVRNQIKYVPIYGLQKGAVGALVDRSGTAFDQAQLMVELLRASGYTASFVSGAVSLNATQTTELLGTTNATAVRAILADGGIPATTTPTSGTVTNVTMAHIWVRVTIGGTNYVFDPGLKRHTFTTGINLATASGWNTTTYLGQAQSGMVTGTESAPSYGNPSVNVAIPYVRNLNVAGSDTQLTTYASNLVNYLRTNGYATKQIEDVVGREDIIPETTVLRQTTLPYALTSPAQRIWAGNIPDVFRTRLTIDYLGLNLQTRLTQGLFADEVYARQIYYEPYTGIDTTWEPDQVRLVVDGVRIGNKYVGSDSPQQRGGYVVLRIDHPYAANDGTYLDRTGTNGLLKRANFISPVVIALGLGDTSQRLADKIAGERGDDRLLPTSSYFGVGGEPLDRPRQPAGESTLLRSTTGWLAQYSRMAMLQSRMRNSVHALHHSLGVAYRRSIVDATRGDLCAFCWSVSQGAYVLDVDTSVSVNSRTASATDQGILALSLSAAADTLEASQLEQSTNAATPASVAHRFHWSSANNTAMRYYLLTSAATSSTLFPQQSFPIGLCYESLFPTMLPYTDAAFKVIAAGDQFTGPGRANGSGSAACTDISSPLYLERGGAFQAFGATYRASANVVTDGTGVPSKGGSVGSPPSYQDAAIPDKSSGLLQDQFKDRGRDFGVDLASGQFSYSPDADVSVGLGEFPYRLEFSRNFRPGEAHSPGLGKGWQHNLDIRVSMSSDGQEALGRSSVLASATTLVALYGTQEIYSTVPGTDAGLLQRWITAPLIQGWWAQNIRFNVVTHTAGGSSRVFVRLPNGKFLPPGAVLPADGDPTSYWKLTQSGTPTGYGALWQFAGVSFTLESPAKDVQTFAFWKRPKRSNETPLDYGPHSGWHITNWTWPKGVSLAFNYVPVSPVNAMTFENDHLSSVQSSLGRTLTFSFTPTNNWDACTILSVNDNKGHAATYNCANNSVTSPAGDVRRVTYGATNCGVGGWSIRTLRPRCSPYLTEVFGPSDTTTPKVRLSYDQSGRVSEYADAVAVKNPGQRTAYRFYVADGARGERQDPAGNSYTVTYDEWGRATRFVDELKRLSRAEYDGLDRVVKRWSPEGILTEFDYDLRGNTTLLKTTPRVTVPPTTPATLSVEATYDVGCGGIKTVKDAKLQVTTWNYYPTTCQVSSIVQPSVLNGVTGTNASPTTNLTYTTVGLLDTVTDPTAVVTDYDYDTDGDRVLKKVNPAGLNLQTSYGHDDVGNITSVTNGNLHQTTYLYDADRRLTRITAPASTCMITENIWQGGLVTKVRNAKICSPNFATDTDWQVWSKNYTPTDQVNIETDPAGDTTDTDYDALDRREYVRQWIGPSDPLRVTRFQYDPAGQLYREYRSWGTVDQITYAEYAYTPDGRQDWVRDARLNLTDLEYDGYGRLSRTVYADSSYEGFSYDNNGNVLTKRNRSGIQISKQYDALNREVSRTVPDNPNYPGDLSRLLTSTYDLASRPWDTTDGQALRSRYDTAGRLLRVEDAFLNVINTNIGDVQYTYDAASNRKTMRFMTGAGWWQQTYNYDDAERLYQVTDGSATLAQFGYDRLGRLETTSYLDGTSAGRVYEGDDDLESLTHTYNGGTLAFTYTSNGAGQIKTITANSTVHLLGPPLAPAAYSPNRLNQYDAISESNLTYDPNGNLRSDGVWIYTYDEENRLRRAERPGTTAVYDYDAFNRRRAKSVNGQTTLVMSDGPNEVAEISSTGARQRFFVNGIGMDERIGLWDDAGATGWHLFHTNHQGSTVLTTRAATGGAPSATYDFGAFGESADTATGNPIRYTGRYLDGETGLYYYRARYMSPGLGRFLQVDPVGTQDDLNLYSYVYGDPPNRSDPTGSYGRGGGFSDREWEDFARAQAQAAKKMEKAADGMEEKAANLDSKGKSGGDKLRARAEKLRQGAKDLRSDGSDGKYAFAVDQQQYEVLLGGSPSGGARADSGSVIVNISNSVWSNDPRRAQWSIGHESLHTGAGLSDQTNDLGIKAYKYSPSPAERRAFKELIGSDKAEVNPDHLMDWVL